MGQAPPSELVSDGSVWRVATWNVLVQAFCQPDRYLDVDPVALDPDRRRSAVVREVVGRVGESDVLCLQEADEALCRALEAEGLCLHVVAHDEGDHAVAVVTGSPRPFHGGDLGGGRSWAGVTLEEADAEPVVVVSCHLRHPGDGPVGTAQAKALADQLRHRFAGMRVAVGADANAAVGGPALEALSSLGLTLLQPSPTAWIRGGERTTDVLALPPGGRLTGVAGPTGPIPTPDWPSDHRLLLGELPRRSTTG